ncbi:MAG TPA: FAD/NAD(P)-binding oxidoreductase [Solirubrobacterales bacterium]|nr:FAD/NAD(P)-binding oxidoreductase [Solirubrobacterales bacterium]
MQSRVLILGAGFGGLELATILSAELGADAGVTLIDEAEAFVFGYSKLDVMFGRTSPESVRLAYAEIDKPGVTFRRETVTAIDPESRRVTTNAGVHEAEHLVVALGAGYDIDATPGVVLGENEFYSVPGAERLAPAVAAFDEGHAVIGVCGAPFKCPPAPSEACLLLDDHLRERGCRDRCTITFVIPLPSPVPPSPETSEALTAAFAERDIRFVPERRLASVDADAKTVALDDGAELPCDLLLAVPRHRAPEVVRASGMAEDGYIPVDSRTLRTRFANVYACGDVATVGVPKAGVFAEGAARSVATSLLAALRGESGDGHYDGLGSCYIEFGQGRVGRVDVDFLSGPKPTGTFQAPSDALVAEKEHFGSSRRARWF